MSTLTISGHSARDSLVKYVVMASLPSSRMDMWNLSDDVKHFASSFETSGASKGFKRLMEKKDLHYWVILSDAGFKLYQQHHVLQVLVSRSQVIYSIASSIRVLQDSIYHMINLTVAHCIRSPASSADIVTVVESTRLCQGSWTMVIFSTSRKRIWQGSNFSIFVSKLLAISGFQASWTRFRSCDHSRRFLNQAEVPSEFTSTHVLYYESVSISNQFVSETLSLIIHYCVARLNDCPHLCQCSFSQHLQEMEFKHKTSQSSRSSHHLRWSNNHFTSSWRSWSAGVNVIKLIASSFRLRVSSTIRIKPHSQVNSDQLQVINVSSCGAQQWRAHSHIILWDWPKMFQNKANSTVLRAYVFFFFFFIFALYSGGLGLQNDSPICLKSGDGRPKRLLSSLRCLFCLPFLSRRTTRGSTKGVSTNRPHLFVCSISNSLQWILPHIPNHGCLIWKFFFGPCWLYRCMDSYTQLRIYLQSAPDYLPTENVFSELVRRKFTDANTDL